MVFAANIQGWINGTPGGENNFGHIQLGYGITNCPSGYSTCTNGMPDNALRFLYTDHDNGDGVFEVPYGSPVPQVGVQYRLTIEATVVNDNPKWTFEIRNLDTSQTYTWNIPRSWTGGGYKAWSGVEIINASSRLHIKDTDTLHRIYNIKYSPPLGGWNSFPNNGCHWAVTNDPNSRGEPTTNWAGCLQDTDTDGDVRIDVWTKYHNSW